MISFKIIQVNIPVPFPVPYVFSQCMHYAYYLANNIIIKMHRLC